MFEIYFDDLTLEAQASFLAAFGLENASEGNYDVFPIATLPTQESQLEGS